MTTVEEASSETWPAYPVPDPGRDWYLTPVPSAPDPLAPCWLCGQVIVGRRLEVVVRRIVAGRVHPECELAATLVCLEREAA